MTDERNPMEFCPCGKYLGHRGFCSKVCHDKYYDENYNTEKSESQLNKECGCSGCFKIADCEKLRIARQQGIETEKLNMNELIDDHLNGFALFNPDCQLCKVKQQGIEIGKKIITDKLRKNSSSYNLGVEQGAIAERERIIKLIEDEHLGRVLSIINSEEE